MSDLDQLDIARRAITALGLGQVAFEDLVAEARASSSRREQDRRALSDAHARIKDLEAKIASNVAEAAARDMRIADLERDLTAKDASLKTAHAAVTRICEVIGAPVPVCPDDAVEAVTTLLGASEYAGARVEAAAATLAEIGLALDDYGTPTHYNAKGSPHDKGAVIPAVERVRVGLMVLWSKWCEAQGTANETEYNLDMLDTEIHHAHKTLDALDVPRQAGGADLDLAARIRAIPR